jgi:hypothetical protein
MDLSGIDAIAAGPGGSPPQVTLNQDAIDASMAPTSGGGGMSGIMSWLQKNPAALIGALPLAMSLFQGNNQLLPAETALTKLATETQGESAALEAPLFSGVLPPGAQEAVDAATRANIASVKSRFAEMGLAGSTMEDQAVQGVQRNAAAQQFQIADQLVGQGITAQGQTANIYSDLLRTQMTKDQQFKQALMLFAAGLARGGGSSNA